tara:strand:+ start:425 stop:1843 length:1419 start_codon:yes stop_codon:yes gene_type:complete
MKLFGTDGIRGRVGEFPITPSDMKKLGYAISKSIFKDKAGLVLISNDGRASADEIEDALREGISKQGAHIASLDLLSTPALSYFVRNIQVTEVKDNSKITRHIGIQITASHNCYQDNGIKIFDTNGLKISGEQENEIENIFSNLDKIPTNVKPIWKDINVKDITAKEANEEYNLATREYLQNKIKKANDEKFLIMIDCANGATSNHVEDIFGDSNVVDFLPIYNQPSGTNINHKCGTTYIDALKKKIKFHNNVEQRKIDLGVAFDGDGDRAIFVTPNGNVIDGDEILYILSKFKKEYKDYQGPVVGTVMTNYGIQAAYKKIGIDFHVADVGDKFVYQKMTDINAEIGGESSGHIITTDFIKIPIGDGILTLINLLEVLSKLKLNLEDFKKITSDIIIPSKLVNITVSDKKKFMENKINQKVFVDLEKKAADSGRVLIRASGTEDLIRVLIEHQDLKEINKLEKYFCDNIQKT